LVLPNAAFQYALLCLCRHDYKEDLISNLNYHYL
jgi:hypothetical protein